MNQSMNQTDQVDRHVSFDQLIKTVTALRGENGCPWDKRQTRETLRPYLLEEAYEVLDAIEAHDMQALREELGDLLLHVLFHAQIASEEDAFAIEDVVADLNEKLVRRHPHVFGNRTVATENDIAYQWDEIKKQEKSAPTEHSVLTGIPKTMPALFRAFKLQKCAATVGFDWTNVTNIWEKLDEEVNELHQALAQHERPNAQQMIEEELGDVLFTIVNMSRFLSVNPELALQRANNKFVERFHHMEQTVNMSGQSIKQLSLSDLDRLWNHAKHATANEQKRENL